MAGQTAAGRDDPPNAKGKRMIIRNDNEQLGNLDRYGDGDEATLRREGAAEAQLEHYDEEDIATVPWQRRPV
jgi:hypothetical protein